MRKINWRWFRVFREEQPDLSPEHHRAEEALDSGDIDISPPPQSAFWKSLHTLDETVLKIMALFVAASLILFVIIFYQQGVIYKQQKGRAEISKLKQSVKSEKKKVETKDAEIVRITRWYLTLENKLQYQNIFEQIQEGSEEELAEAIKQGEYQLKRSKEL